MSNDKKKVDCAVDQEELQGDTSSMEHKFRLKKVHDLRSQGIEPWPEVRYTNSLCQDVVKEFDSEVETSESDSKVYELGGRIVSMRLHGKTAFGHVQDRSGKLQFYVRKDVVGDTTFEFLQSFVDIGDIVWLKGISFKTKTGEITLKVEDMVLLSKCLHPLPEKFHGLVDTEKKYRQRYLDLIVNAESRAKFETRSKIIRIFRDYFDEADFIEVETPMLHPIPGGAAARPFVTHHNTFDTEFFLRIAPELYLKRLVIGGFERVYEIGRCFRNEGVSTRHNPEFTILEAYMAYCDYNMVMDFIEGLLKKVVSKCCDGEKVQFGEHEIDFSKPFDRLSIYDSIKKFGNYKDIDLEAGTIDKALNKAGVMDIPKDASVGKKMFALFEEVIEDKLIDPVFITDYPVEVSPLSKRKSKDSPFVSRFELFMCGMEFANGFNELNDPFDQADRFREQARGHKDDEATLGHKYDEDYVLALEHALPPTAGFGIGIDRFVMLITNTTSIKDVILFPTLRRKKAE